MFLARRTLITFSPSWHPRRCRWRGVARRRESILQSFGCRRESGNGSITRLRAHGVIGETHWSRLVSQTRTGTRWSNGAELIVQIGDECHFPSAEPSAATNGGIALLFQSPRLVAAVAELGAIGAEDLSREYRRQRQAASQGTYFASCAGPVGQSRDTRGQVHYERLRSLGRSDAEARELIATALAVYIWHTMRHDNYTYADYVAELERLPEIDWDGDENGDA